MAGSSAVRSQVGVGRGFVLRFSVPTVGKSQLALYQQVASKKALGLGPSRRSITSMYPSDDLLNNLSPEVRQRVEQSLQALGGGVTPQNIFVSQYPSAIPDHVPQGAQPRSQHASG